MICILLRELRSLSFFDVPPLTSNLNPPSHNFLTEDVDFDIPLLQKKMKQLTCRKCEGHGVLAVLKGHAPHCPYNECPCDTCGAVMQLRASALVRRFRHRAPDEPSALLKTIRSKNGNMRLRILPKRGTNTQGGTEVVYRRSSVTSSSSSSSSSNPSPSPPINDYLTLLLQYRMATLNQPWQLSSLQSLLLQGMTFQPPHITSFTAPFPGLF